MPTLQSYHKSLDAQSAAEGRQDGQVHGSARCPPCPSARFFGNKPTDRRHHLAGNWYLSTPRERRGGFLGPSPKTGTWGGPFPRTTHPPPRLPGPRNHPSLPYFSSSSLLADKHPACA